MHTSNANPNSFLVRLPSAWQAVLRGDPIAVGGKADHRGGGEPDHYLHKSDLEALLGRLKQERLRRRRSQSDVSRVTNQARSAISRLENGRYPNPTFDTVYRYASALGQRVILSIEPLPPAQ